MQRIMNEEAESLTETVSQTVRGAMYGLLGTALPQAMVAAIGFPIAGVPAVLLLSVLVFISSLIPVGPPLI
ncbi:AI-2E family transporter [Massilia sp. LXY-6]|uniref:AI-2E family transporter n=1 Tax=Massilia sp. LXY-6 TaxID=3379823 RepID=UPI003EE38B03